MKPQTIQPLKPLLSGWIQGFHKLSAWNPWEKTAKNDWAQWCFLGFIGFLAYPNEIGFSLFGGSEGLYAQIVREMVTTNQFLHLTFLGETYSNKPPLFFWILGIFREVFGENEIALRLPGAIFSLGTMGLTYCLGRMLLSRIAAFWGALVVATTYVFLWNGRHVQFDSLLTFFMTLAVFAWAKVYIKGGSQLWYPVAFLAMAFGSMIKSVHAFALPFLLMVAHSLIQRDYRAFKNLGFWTGLSVFLCIIYGYSWILEPQFHWHFEILGSLSRAIDSSALHVTIGHSPIHWYLYMLWFCFFPWCALILPSLVALYSKRPFRSHPAELFILLWFFGYLLLFSISQFKAERYLLPLVPCLGLMIGYYYDKALSSPDEKKWATLLTRVSIGLLSIAFVVAFTLGPTLLHRKWSVPFTVFSPIYVAIMLTLCLAIFSGLLCSKVKWPLSLFGILAIGLMIGVNYLLVPAIDRAYSPKQVDKEIRSYTSNWDFPGFQYGLTQEDLIFYLNSPPPFIRLPTIGLLQDMVQKYKKIFVVTDYDDLAYVRNNKNMELTILREFPQPRERNFFLLSIRPSPFS